MDKKRGFTLLELVIVIALSGIFAFFLAGIIKNGVEAWYFVVEKEELVLQTPYALNRLIRDLRSAQSVSSALSNSITFLDYQNNVVSYTISRGILYRNGIEILDGVTNFSLQYYPSSSNIRRVIVSVERSKGDYSLLLRSGVNLRK